MIKDKIMFHYCTLIVKFHIVKIGVKYILKIQLVMKSIFHGLVTCLKSISRFIYFLKSIICNVCFMLKIPYM